MDGFKLRNVNLQQTQNQNRHKTEGLSSTGLVLRRGQSFKVLLNFDVRPFDPRKERLVFRIVLGQLFVELPVSVSTAPPQNQWGAQLEQGAVDPNLPNAATVSLFSPASAPVGVYNLHLRVETRTGSRTYTLTQFTLLCNPWAKADSVFLATDSLREEYVRNDFGMLFKGTPENVVARPWSFDQYEKEILDICLKILQVSPQQLADSRKDYLNRTDPVYISRVVSAMINSQDDKGVLAGNWSGDYADGVNPSKWSGSGDILKQWSDSKFSPVKYGQCWVFAAVMCTVMRALGIPTRVITNFNSAHDTNKNLEIEEYYSETGEKLSLSKDSIWNFHVWVECWMKRPDLGRDYDGWQVLDPTPQERSAGMYRCGPAALKAIREREVNQPYDVPFVYAEVNADVRTMIVRDGEVLDTQVDTTSVGALICTKTPGSTAFEDITKEYKTESEPFMRAAFAADGRAGGGVARRRAAQPLAVSLSLLKKPIVGENIAFNVTIINGDSTPKVLREHVNAQTKEYNDTLIGTFWEVHKDVKIGPNETLTLQHNISFNEYALKEVREDSLVNLAVVIEDLNSQQRVLAHEEFNISSPALNIQIVNEHSVIVNVQQVAMVTFTSPFNKPVNGELIVAGSGLLEEKAKMRVQIQPGETMKRPVHFTPRMTGSKMLHAGLILTNMPTVLRGFKTIDVKDN